jgi:hypothetical protein
LARFKARNAPVVNFDSPACTISASNLNTLALAEDGRTKPKSPGKPGLIFVNKKYVFLHKVIDIHGFT